MASVAACAMTAAANAQVAESGDAGDVFSGWQDTAGSGPLTTISGSTDAFGGDFTDAYSIRVTDVQAFYATTDPDIDPLADAGGLSMWDTRLLLFDMSGNLVMANEDSPQTFNSQSYLSDGSTFPGALVDSPGSLVAGQSYILAITGNSNELFDADDIVVADFSSDSDALVGASGGAGPATHWENGGPLQNGFYTIALNGATFSIPAPGALALFGVAGLAGRRRRRR